MQTSWLSGSPFVESDVDSDCREIRNVYVDRGFFDVQVQHHETFSNDRSEAKIEIVIDEGIRCRIRHIEFIGNDAISDAELREGMNVRTNDFWDRHQLQADGEKIKARYRKLGAFDPSAKPEHASRSSANRPSSTSSSESGRRSITTPNGSMMNRPPKNRQEPNDCWEQESSSPVQAELLRLKRKSDNSREPNRTNRRAPNPSAATCRHRRFHEMIQLQCREAVEPPGQCDFNQMVFIGVETFDASEIRHRLAVDFDLIVAAPATAASSTICRRLKFRSPMVTGTADFSLRRSKCCTAARSIESKSAFGKGGGTDVVKCR